MTEQEKKLLQAQHRLEEAQARDKDALNAAFAEYSGYKAKNQEKPSVIKRARELKKPELAKAVAKAHSKDMGLEL